MGMNMIMRSGTRAVVVGDGGDEGHVAAAEELGEKQGGVALGLGGLDPVQARPQYARLAAPFSEHSATVAAHDSFFPLFFFLIKIFTILYQNVEKKTTMMMMMKILID
ncbi:LOW QUALITY PROTEIN: hypothetical protein TorRG33x02_131300 [Trema orientale]|uniref:Uncharacterized protein n=1 Tax=Trema orientale TaxID=63057 RepID=A0A2P5EZY2_TREOI|nr:LOW QUALITY PROTEIN: hypothetical protein TorRG33x02_131300 [Trema orientale]